MSDETGAFFTLHRGLLREGPGSDASTLRALAATGLSGPLRVADMGAGPGAATLLLLRALPEAQITAIDLHKPYLDTLEARAAAAGLAARLTVRVADMADPGIAPGTLDLVWCEAALYFLGVEAGLRCWRPLLRPGARVVFSEAIWLSDDPPEAARLFWMEYPAMTTRAGVLARIAAAGYRVIADFVLPEADWHSYLGPLGTRAESLRPGADATLRDVLDGAQAEAKLFERHGDTYAYAMFVVEPGA